MINILDALKAKHPEATGDTIGEIIATMESGGGGGLFVPAATVPAFSGDVSVSEYDGDTFAHVKGWAHVDATDGTSPIVQNNTYTWFVAKPFTISLTYHSDGEEITETRTISTNYIREYAYYPTTFDISRNNFGGTRQTAWRYSDDDWFFEVEYMVNPDNLVDVPSFPIDLLIEGNEWMNSEYPPHVEISQVELCAISLEAKFVWDVLFSKHD